MIELLNNSVVSIVIVFILIFLSIVSVIVSKKSSLPVVLHNSLWTVALLLIASNVIKYSESSFGAWFVLAAALVLFNLAGITAQFLVLKRDQKNVFGSEQYLQSYALLKWNLLRFFLYVYLTGFLVYLVSVGIRYGPFTIFFDPAAVRLPSEEGSYLETVPFFARLIISLGPVLFMLVGSSFAIVDPPTTRKILIILVLLAVSMILLLQRTNLFMAMIWLLVAFVSFHFYSSKNRTSDTKIRNSISSKSIKKSPLVLIVIAVVAGVLVFQGIALALGKTGGNFPENVVDPILQDSGLVSLVTYASGGTVAFLQLQDAPENSWVGSDVDGARKTQTNGAALALPILKIFPITEPWAQISPYIFVPFEINVYTWFEPFYRDFREAGVWFGAAIMGFVTVLAFGYRFRYLWVFWVQTGLLLSVFFAPFVFKFYDTIYLLGTSLLLALSIFQQKKSRNIKIE